VGNGTAALATSIVFGFMPLAAGDNEAAALRVIHYVSIGDSVTSVTPSFVATVAERAGVALHGKVVVTRIVEEGAVGHLVTGIRSSPAMRDAIRRADLITITVGANEIGEAADEMAPNGCSSSDGSACVRKAERDFEKSYGTMLTQLTRLRPSSRTAYRLLTSYDTPGVFTAAKGRSFTAALKAENRFVRGQAARRQMKSVDVFRAFNGADGSRDPQANGLTVPDGHPSARGSATIAKAVVAAGFAPLH
jgi:lysophospholipase L1-like esterase